MEVQSEGDGFSGYVCERGEIGDGSKTATHRPWLKGVVWQVTSDSDEVASTNEQALVNYTLLQRMGENRLLL
jgi:hypothetical protein